MPKPFFKIPRIHIIRHAESKWNVSGQVQGSLADPNITLTPAGIATVKPSLQFLRKPDVLISSPLLRCIQTAETWFDMPFDQIKILTKVDPDIREIHAGTYEGLYIKDLKNDALWTQWMRDPSSFIGFPGGENLDVFSKRVLRSVGAACTAYPHENQQVTMFSHGVAMRVIKCFINNQSLSYLWNHKIGNLEHIALSEEQILRFQHYYQQCSINEAILLPNLR